MSACWIGSTHDLSLLKLELPPEKGWFKDLCVRLDLGYAGFDKVYECVAAVLPKKRKKGAKLTDEEKAENKQKSQERVFVEHSIAGLKRYRILSDRLRNKKFDLYNDFLEVCAGLWNFYLLN